MTIKRVKKVCVIFVLIFTASIQSKGQSEFKLSGAEARQDIRRLEYIVFDGHINLPYVVDTTLLRSQFKELISLTNDSVSSGDLFVRLAKVFYMIQDAHCAIIIPNDCNNYHEEDSLYLPLVPIFFNGKMFVQSCMNDTITQFSEILKINDWKASEILDTLLHYTSADGSGYYTKTRMASQFFLRLFPMLFKVHDINDIVYVTKNADTLRFSLQGMMPSDPDYKDFLLETEKKGKDPFRLKLSNADSIAILTIDDFTSGNPGEFERFLFNSFAIMQKENTRTLILDMRNNTGGYADRGAVLCKYFFHNPFVYTCNLASKAGNSIRQEILRQSPFQREWFMFISKNIGSQSIKQLWRKPAGEILSIKTDAVQPFRKSIVFDGQLYVLFNGYSASTTGLVINCLSQRANTIFVGEPAACMNNGTFGQPTVFELPNSGIIGYISILRFNQDCFRGIPEIISPVIDFSNIPWFSVNQDEDPWMNELLRIVKKKK